MEIISKYFQSLNNEQIGQFRAMYDLFIAWNQKINVVSRKDIEELYLRHVLHSLSIARFIRFKAGTRVLDLGTGGGFPGIPLAILFPETNFVLIDSIQKKIMVVKEIASELKLNNVDAFQKNAGEYHKKFDFVVSRAVTSMSKLVGLCRDNISKQNSNAIPNGLICLKGGDLSKELKDFRNTAQLIALRDYFEESFFETKYLVYLPMR